MEILGIFLFEGLKCLRQAGLVAFSKPVRTLPFQLRFQRRFHIEALDLIQQEKLWQPYIFPKKHKKQQNHCLIIYYSI